MTVLGGDGIEEPPRSRMPRYWFHVESREADLAVQRADLPDLDSAMAEAVRYASAMRVEQNEEPVARGWHIRVADEKSHTVLRLAIG